MLEKLGRFEIKGVLGRGAMGEVYLGVDPSIGREVAIKTILPNASHKEDAKRRFAREARAAGALNHPNIVTIYEFGEDQDILYIAMERVKGQDLEELIRLQGLSNSEVLEVLAQVCDGLEFSHRHGVIHRDIKPSNVRVLRDGRRLQVKVMDFGVARLDSGEMTATGTVVGTVSYMAPEYISTGKPDARSDLFAVGVMLYECISGRKPFGGDTAPTILYKIVHEPPDPIDLSHLDDISPAVRAVLDRTLAKVPAQRFESAEELARALRAAKDPTWQGPTQEATVWVGSRAEAATTVVEQNPQAQATVQLVVPMKKPSRRPVLLAIAATALLALGAYSIHKLRAASSVPEPTNAQAGLVTRSPSATPSTTTTGQPPPVSSQRSPVPTPVQRPTEAKPAPPLAHPESNPHPRETPPTPEAFRKMSAQQRQSMSGMTLSEAINLADTDPKRALDGFKGALAADPTNANAYAWTVAILYEQGRYNEIPSVFAKARVNGIDKAGMMNNVRFRMAMQNDRLNHRIPGARGE